MEHADQERFERAVEVVIEEGERLMRETHGPEGKDPKVYHVPEHPEAMQGRAEHIANVFDLSPERRGTVKIAVSWHDTVLEYDPPDPNDITAMIKRHRGAREGDAPSGSEGNEAKSAKRMAEAMRRANQEAGAAISSEESIARAVYAVEATYPAVNLGKDFSGAPFTEYPFYQQAVQQNPLVGETLEMLSKKGITKGPLFYQPHLERPLEQGEQVPEEVVIVALADLGAGGMADNPEEVFEEGNQEFLELSANIRKLENRKRLLEGEGARDVEDREKAAKAMRQWIGMQPSFFAWQMLRVEKIIYLLKRNGELDDERELQLRKLFGNFPRNVAATEERSERVERTYGEKQKEEERTAFRYLAQEMRIER